LSSLSTFADISERILFSVAQFCNFVLSACIFAFSIALEYGEEKKKEINIYIYIYT